MNPKNLTEHGVFAAISIAAVTILAAAAATGL